MLPIFLSILSIIIIIILIIFFILIILYYQNKNNKKTIFGNLQELVDKINNSQYYEYKFDINQDQNIKNIDQNLTEVNNNLIKLQNNVNFIEQNSILKNDIKSELNTNRANINNINTNTMTIGNSTNKNNIIIEGGRTSDGNNEGLSAINFNGYYNNGDKHIDSSKGRWRIISDQRDNNDSLSIDQWNKDNNWWNYMYMNDNTVNINNAKLRFSNQWSGYPDDSTDNAEISNDATGYKQLMIVGNKSSGEGISKVGIWDRLDVHGNLGVDGNINIQNQICIDDICIDKNELKNIKSLKDQIKQLQQQYLSIDGSWQSPCGWFITFRYTSGGNSGEEDWMKQDKWQYKAIYQGNARWLVTSHNWIFYLDDTGKLISDSGINNNDYKFSRV